MILAVGVLLAVGVGAWLGIDSATTATPPVTRPPVAAPRPPKTVPPNLDPLTQPGFSFDDEFTGPAGASPNYGLRNKYWFSDPCWSSGCGSPTSPTRYSAKNAYLNGQGNLVLVARRGASGTCGDQPCTYTSARLTMVNWTKDSNPVSFSQRYGTFTARIRMPAGAGLWPAFWLVGANIGAVGWPTSGEIDALEVYTPSGAIQQHVEFGSPEAVHKFGAGWPLPPGESITGWHDYSIVWSPQGITWEVDGRPTLTMDAAEAGTDWSQFQKPFSIILDLAVGGIAGTPPPSTHFPAKMLVDWVHVTTHN